MLRELFLYALMISNEKHILKSKFGRLFCILRPKFSTIFSIVFWFLFSLYMHKIKCIIYRKLNCNKINIAYRAIIIINTYKHQQTNISIQKFKDFFWKYIFYIINVGKLNVNKCNFLKFSTLKDDEYTG